MVQWVISILPGTPITNQRCIRLQGEVGLYPAMDDFLWTSIRPSLRLDCASSASNHAHYLKDPRGIQSFNWYLKVFQSAFAAQFFPIVCPSYLQAIITPDSNWTRTM